jgi:hypothetical protein
MAMEYQKLLRAFIIKIARRTAELQMKLENLIKRAIPTGFADGLP